MSPGTEGSLIAGLILPLPQDIGYSMAATVAAVGKDVTDYKPGDKVVATARHASYQLVDQRLVSPAPAGIDMEQAAFFNLAHTGLYGIRRAGLQLGEPALIMGQGLVGALTTQLALASGAAPVIVTDVDDTRLELARKVGVHHAINPQTEPDALDAIVEELGLGGIPVIFEATGQRAPVEQAVQLVSERGRIVMLSTVHGDTVPNITEPIMMKGACLYGAYVNSKPFSLRRTDLTIAGCWPPTVAEGSRRYANHDVWTSDEDIRGILNLINYGSLDVRPLISHRFTVDQIPEAYDLVWKKDRSLVGGTIRWK
jgi:threonine dehydrogenase-like Zn-dependent dehydrogenase